MVQDRPRSGRGASLRTMVLATAVVLMIALVVQRRSRRASQTPSFPDSDYASVRAPPRGALLVGTNYTHHSFEGCEASGTGILATYHEPGVASTVHGQLASMRRAGISSLRLIVWHMTDTPGQRWGVVPSRGGRLAEPYRGNLVAYLREVRRFGFARLTISFSPQSTNDPRKEVWNSGSYKENWGFIRDVRSLAKRFGPADVRYDLMNEGAPSDHAPEARRRRMSHYLERLYAAYVDAFGARDVTISVIAPRGPGDGGDRLGNLIDLLDDVGTPLPRWFEIHLNHDPAGVAHGLRYADSLLTARGLGQPLTIGETSYDDPAVAAAIRAYLTPTARPLAELVQWYRRVGAACDVSPPFRADWYLCLGRGAEEGAHGFRIPAGDASSLRRR